MKKPVVLTPHAVHMLAERTIKAEWVEAVVAEPEVILPDLSDPMRRCAFGRIAQFGGRWLRVVFIDTEEATKVITAFFDRGMERKR